MKKAENIDAYISGFPEKTQRLLEQVRAAIQKAAPKAAEVISYGMPAFKLNRVLVYFAGYNSHIGFYPTSSGIAAFKKDISKYKNSKGAVQFPIDGPMPLALIGKIVKFRIKADEAKTKIKSSKKTAAGKKPGMKIKK